MRSRLSELTFVQIQKQIWNFGTSQIWPSLGTSICWGHIVLQAAAVVMPWHLCRGVYGFLLSVCIFVHSCFHHVRGIYYTVFHNIIWNYKSV